MTREEKALRWYQNRVAVSEFAIAKEVAEVSTEVRQLRFEVDPAFRREIRAERDRAWIDLVSEVERNYADIRKFFPSLPSIR